MEIFCVNLKVPTSSKTSDVDNQFAEYGVFDKSIDEKKREMAQVGAASVDRNMSEEYHKIIRHLVSKKFNPKFSGFGIFVRNLTFRGFRFFFPGRPKT